MDENQIKKAAFFGNRITAEELAEALIQNFEKVALKIGDTKYCISDVISIGEETGFLKKEYKTKYSLKLRVIFERILPYNEVCINSILQHEGREYCVTDIRDGYITAKIVETDLENLERRVAELEGKFKIQEQGECRTRGAGTHPEPTDTPAKRPHED